MQFKILEVHTFQKNGDVNNEKLLDFGVLLTCLACVASFFLFLEFQPNSAYENRCV